MADTTVKKIICSSCGAEFEDTLPKCPYCGSLNYKGAEAEYLGKLESMRQDMQQLEQVPEKELKKKLKKKQKFVIKLLILLAALAAILAVIVFRVQYIEPRDARADYLWEKENFPILDRLYQEKDLEALMDFYEQAVEENRTIDRWEHSGIFRWLMSCRDAREYLALEQSGETLNEYQQALLLDDYWMMRGLDYSEVILTEKDREYIRPYVEATLNSLADRYTFTAEEEKKFEDSLRNNYGYPRYEDCEEYFENLEDSGSGRSTLNMQVEDFYAGAKDADILIYNSSIDGGVTTVDELIGKCNILKDFKAVQEGQVYCTTNDMYQQSMAVGYLLQDMHTVLTDDDTVKLRYLFLLQ